MNTEDTLDDLPDGESARVEELLRAALDRHAYDVDVPVAFEPPRPAAPPTHSGGWLRRPPSPCSVAGGTST